MPKFQAPGWIGVEVNVMIWKMLGLAVAVSLLAAGAARADAIDGQWCLSGSSFEIRGPTIRTPGGNEIAGRYNRHGFSYIVPASEPGSGAEVVMVLRGEDVLDLTRGGGAPETWRRCKPTS